MMGGGIKMSDIKTFRELVREYHKQLIQRLRPEQESDVQVEEGDEN